MNICLPKKWFLINSMLIKWLSTSYFTFKCIYKFWRRLLSGENYFYKAKHYVIIVINYNIINNISYFNANLVIVHNYC